MELQATHRKMPATNPGREVEPASASRAGIRRRVLLVDDDSAVLELLRATLRHYDVITATSARIALEILRNEHVDVVVADEKMPEMSGCELLSIVSREFPACG